MARTPGRHPENTGSTPVTRSISPSAKLFIIYDERAILEGTDEATVLCTARSLREARNDIRTMFPRGVIYSYDCIADKLLNEQFEAFPNGEP